MYTHLRTRTVQIGWTVSTPGYFPTADGWRADATRAWATIQFEHAGSDLAVTEDLFIATNTYSGPLWDQVQPVLPGEPRDHTAISIGDQVTIDGISYGCQRLGWVQRISPDQLRDLILEVHPDKFSRGGAQAIATLMLQAHPLSIRRDEIDTAANDYTEYESLSVAYEAITGRSATGRDEEAMLFHLLEDRTDVVAAGFTVPDSNHLIVLSY